MRNVLENHGTSKFLIVSFQRSDFLLSAMHPVECDYYQIYLFVCHFVLYSYLKCSSIFS